MLVSKQASSGVLRWNTILKLYRISMIRDHPLWKREQVMFAVLKELYQQDQADRHQGMPEGTLERDRARRQQVAV